MVIRVLLADASGLYGLLRRARFIASLFITQRCIFVVSSDAIFVVTSALPAW